MNFDFVIDNTKLFKLIIINIYHFTSLINFLDFLILYLI